MGFLGSAVILCCYLLIIIAGLTIASMTTDPSAGFWPSESAPCSLSRRLSMWHDHGSAADYRHDLSFCQHGRSGLIANYISIVCSLTSPAPARQHRPRPFESTMKIGSSHHGPPCPPPCRPSPLRTISLPPASGGLRLGRSVIKPKDRRRRRNRRAARTSAPLIVQADLLYVRRCILGFRHAAGLSPDPPPRLRGRRPFAGNAMSRTPTDLRQVGQQCRRTFCTFFDSSGPPYIGRAALPAADTHAQRPGPCGQQCDAAAGPDQRPT